MNTFNTPYSILDVQYDFLGKLWVVKQEVKLLAFVFANSSKVTDDVAFRACTQSCQVVLVRLD